MFSGADVSLRVGDRKDDDERKSILRGCMFL